MNQNKFNELIDLFKELYDLMIDREVNGFKVIAHNNKYAIPILRNIIRYSSSVESHNQNNAFISNIKQEYLSLFSIKSGLSEFYVWSDDYDTRKKINDRYTKIREQIDEILSDY